MTNLVRAPSSFAKSAHLIFRRTREAQGASLTEAIWPWLCSPHHLVPCQTPVDIVQTRHPWREMARAAKALAISTENSAAGNVATLQWYHSALSSNRVFSFYHNSKQRSSQTHSQQFHINPESDKICESAQSAQGHAQLCTNTSSSVQEHKVQFCWPTSLNSS